MKLTVFTCIHRLMESHEMLLQLKNRGGLVIPSVPVFKIIQRCEQLFRQTVLAEPKKYMNKKQLRSLLVAIYNRSVLEDRPIALFRHACPVDIGLMPHTEQLSQRIVKHYFDIRLKHYCKTYNSLVVSKGSSSDRSRLSRYIIFKNQ